MKRILIILMGFIMIAAPAIAEEQMKPIDVEAMVQAFKDFSAKKGSTDIGPQEGMNDIFFQFIPVGTPKDAILPELEKHGFKIIEQEITKKFNPEIAEYYIAVKSVRNFWFIIPYGTIELNLSMTFSKDKKLRHGGTGAYTRSTFL